MNKYFVRPLFLTIVFSASFLFSNENIEIDRLPMIGEYIDPLENHKFFFDKIYNGKNQLIYINTSMDSSINIKNIASGNSLYLNNGEFIQIVGNDNIKKLFNGSIIIKFKSMPDLQNYATLKEIELITDMSQIQRGIFKVRNLYELSIIIDNIKTDQNVLEIELQTLNPDIKPQ
tara:strand:+ start:627 stop:1148 length:522 start_codon:yes stop_codon:yes gene_type:complete